MTGEGPVGPGELSEDEIAARVAAVRRELGMATASRPVVNRPAMAALVLGILALGCLGFFSGVPALICAAIGLRRAAVLDGTGRTTSIIGIVAAVGGCAWSIAYAVSLAT